MNIEAIKQGVVRIVRNDGTSGTGFLCTPSGHILTCWHVIEPQPLTHVRFEGQAEPILAHVSKELSNFEEDIVVLKIDPPNRTPLPLGLEWSVGDNIWAYGYQYQEHLSAGYPLTGKITGETRLFRDQQMIVISDTDVQRGLSGAPVLDLETNKIVGMINAKFDDKGVGFAIPISTVLKNWPELKGLIVREHKEFVREVASLFGLQGYKIEIGKTLKDHLLVDIYGEIALGVTKVRIVAACLQAVNLVRKKDLEEFAFTVCSPLFAQREIEKAFFVTDKGYTNDAIEFAKSLGIQLTTYKELQENLIDFTYYLQSVIYDYENYHEYSRGQRYPIIEYFRWCDLNKFYIDLRCRDLLTGEDYGSLDSFIDQWLNKRSSTYLSVVPNPAHLSVLGNYGTGKTSFCLHLTYRLAKRYVENPVGNRIPLFFSLRNFDPETEIRRSINETLSEYGVVVNDYRAFEKMANTGRLLLVFDGFDEMVDRLDRKNVLTKFDRIGKLATANSKVILTCRTHYFRTEPESIDFLAPESMTELMLEVKSRENYDIVEIKEFDQEQILELLSRHADDPKSYWEKIQSVYNLADLARRPILLSMIIQTLPELLKMRRQIDSTSLYEVYTKYWIEREDWRSPISKESKLFFMEELAWQMFSSDRLAIHHEDLVATIKSYFQSKAQVGENLANLDTNIRTCSFLVRDKYGNYTFVHKSFMEFFVAKKLARDIRNKEKTNLSLKPIPYEIVVFLKDLLSPDDISNVKNFVIYSEYNEMLRSVCMDILMFLGQTIKEIPFIFGMSYSRDGKHIAAGSADGNVRIWNSTLLQQLRLIKGHTDWVRTVDYSPDGKYLASTGWDGTIRVFKLPDYIEHLLIKNTDKLVSLDFGPDSERIATGGFDKNVKIWNVHSGSLLHTFAGHRDIVWCVRYSPDGRYVASGSVDKTVRLWPMDSSGQEFVLRGHTEAVASVCFDLSGKYLVSGGWVGEMILWDIGKKELIYKIQAHTNKINMFSFSPDGKYLATASDDRKIKIWVYETGELVHVLSEPKDFVMAIQYSPDGKTICAGGYDTKLRLWDTKTWELLHQADQSA